MFAIKQQGIEGIEEHSDTQATVTNVLEAAVVEKFLEKTNEGYKFGHDKVQTAFRSMVSPSTTIPQLHKLIGETYLERDAKVTSIFNAATHLNLASELIQDSEQGTQLVQINLDASKYCLKKSSFETSARLLRKGLSLLPQDDRKWSDHYHLALDLTASLVKMEGILGKFIECHAMIDVVL